MNTESNTPPNGDFARYVEQLSARAAQPGRVAQSGDHGLDVGMTPGSGAPGAVATAAQRRESSNGQGAKPVLSATVLKVLGGVGALVFIALWLAGVPFFVLALVVGAALWFGKTFFKGVKISLAPGAAKWQQVLEEAARKQREQQQKQGK